MTGVVRVEKEGQFGEGVWLGRQGWGGEGEWGTALLAFLRLPRHEHLVVENISHALLLKITPWGWRGSRPGERSSMAELGHAVWRGTGQTGRWSAIQCLHPLWQPSQSRSAHRGEAQVSTPSSSVHYTRRMASCPNCFSNVFWKAGAGARALPQLTKCHAAWPVVNSKQSPNFKSS